MSKLRNSDEYEKSFAYRFKRWMSGEKDPYLGEVEMQPQEVPVDPRKKYVAINRNVLASDSYRHHVSDALKRNKKIYTIISIIICILLIGVYVYAVSFLPPVGDPANPTNNEVAARYIEKGLQETGSVNILTGMILTYRAFDTFGETNVLFVATCAVMILLMFEDKWKRLELKLDEVGMEALDDPILKVIAKILCPIIFMFGIYVILNGHLSPGGGFSGGSIVGAGMILYAAAFGFDKTQRWFNEHIYVIIKVTALMLYGFIGLYFFTTGANGLPSIFPMGTPGAILSGGIILPIDICVGTEVSCTIYAFYALFRRGGI